MSQTTILKPFAEKYYTEEVLFEDFRYKVRRKFNQEFTRQAQEYAMQLCKEEIFDKRHKDNPPKPSGNEENDAKMLAIWNWTIVTADDVSDYFGSLLFFSKIETAKICMACEPIGEAPPIKEVLMYMDDEKIDLVKSFFTSTKPKGGLRTKGAPSSPRPSKKSGRARKQS